MQIGLLHGFILNPILGLAAGWLIGRICRSRGALAPLVMAIGVTAAMWTVGLLVWNHLNPFLEAWFSSGGASPLAYSWWLLWCLVGAWILGFAVLMIPCAAIALDPPRRSRRNILRAAVVASVVNVGTVGLLFAVFASTSLLRLREVSADTIVTQTRVESVYYMNADDGQLWRVSLDGHTRAKVCDLPDWWKSGPCVPLVLDSSDGKALVTIHYPARLTASLGVGVDVTFPKGSIGDYPNNAISNGVALNPGADKAAFIRFDSASRGIRLRRTKDSAPIVLGADVPFLTWNDWDYFRIREPMFMTALPDGLIVCQIGLYSASIVLIDPAQRTFATLARGYAPIVATADPTVFGP